MNMFSESLISFETAKLAKEKGFNEICISTYNLTEYVPKRKVGIKNSEFVKAIHTENSCTAPTQGFLQKWLREVHKIDIVIGSNVLGYHVLLYNRNTGKTINVSPVNLTQFYEEALEIGLLTALKLIN